MRAAPPGSPLALPLIYSSIHLCCCHMAPFLPPHPLPPFPISYLRAAHLRGLSIKICSPPFSPYVHFSTPLPHRLLSSPFLSFPSASPLGCNKGPLPPSPVLQFTPKVSADPILPPSAIDVSLSKSLGSSVMQTRPTAVRKGRGGGHKLPFSNQQPTSVFIFMAI